MKVGKKVQKKLNARLRGHAEALALASLKNKNVPDGSRKQPGSRNPRKG